MPRSERGGEEELSSTLITYFDPDHPDLRSESFLRQGGATDANVGKTEKPAGLFASESLQNAKINANTILSENKFKFTDSIA